MIRGIYLTTSLSANLELYEATVIKPGFVESESFFLFNRVMTDFYEKISQSSVIKRYY